jgi:hypothetical protein
MKGYALTEETNETVMAVGSLNLEGNITPQSWFDHLRYDNGKPHTNAIIILSDIVYWYRPVEVRDEQTGRLVGYRKKFKGDHLQRSRASYEEQYGFSKKQVKDAFDFLEGKKVISILVEKRVTTNTGETLGNVPYIQLHAEKLAEINTPLVPTGPSYIPTGPSLVPTSPTNTDTSTDTSLNGFAANDARQQPIAQVVQPHSQQAPRTAKSRKEPSGQAALFEVPKVEPEKEQEVAPPRPRKPDPMYDAISQAWNTESGMAGKIRQQLLGKMPKSHPHYASNFDEPATPEEVAAFAEWYRKRYDDCDMPMSPEKIQHHFAAFRRERTASARKNAPRTRVQNGRLLRYDPDIRDWYDIGPAPVPSNPQPRIEAYAS